MNNKCLKCKCDLEDKATQYWEIAEVIDYKKKTASFTGFPSGETHTVQGWKIRPLGQFATAYCDACRNSLHKTIHQAQIKRFRNAVIACLLEAMIVIALAHDWLPVIWAFAAVAGGFICLFSVILWIMTTSTLEMSKEQLHAMSVAFSRTVIDLPKQGLPQQIGAIFRVDPTTWSYLSAGFRETERNTGWSHFHYLRSFAYNSQECSPQQGAELLGVADLGTYLTAQK